jgi:hypothetical protein
MDWTSFTFSARRLFSLFYFTTGLFLLMIAVCERTGERLKYHQLMSLVCINWFWLDTRQRRCSCFDRIGRTQQRSDTKSFESLLRFARSKDISEVYVFDASVFVFNSRLWSSLRQRSFYVPKIILILLLWILMLVTYTALASLREYDPSYQVVSKSAFPRSTANRTLFCVSCCIHFSTTTMMFTRKLLQRLQRLLLAAWSCISYGLLPCWC